MRTKFMSWLGSWQEWGTIILLFLALAISVGSIEQAQWITPRPSLILVLSLSLLAGWLLGKSRLPAIAEHLLALALGAGVTVWLASRLLASAETQSQVGQLFVALQSWWQAVSAGSPGEGTIHFVVFLVFLTWVMGYISIWFVLRNRNAWVAVSLGIITILVNLSNLPEQHFSYFFFYTLTALLLLGMTSLTRQNHNLKGLNASYSYRSGASFAASLFCLSTLAVSLAWLTPQVSFEQLENLVGTKTLWVRKIEKQINNFLATIPAKQPFLKSDEKRTLLFGDSSFDRGDQLQFVVNAQQPLYLRSRMYDRYVSSGWASSGATEEIFRWGARNLETTAISKRSQITYTVVPKMRTDIVLTSGDFVSSDVPASVQTLAPVSFSLNMLYDASDSSLPADLASLAQSLRAAHAAKREISLAQLRQLLPRDMTLTDTAVSQESLEAQPTPELLPISPQLSTVKVARMQPASRDTVAVTSVNSLRPDRRYRVTTSISSATPDDLSPTGADYPNWVTDYYLQLPTTFPERVRRLSETVTKAARSPYDKVIAIRDYLAQNEYRVEVKAPPRNVDGVDHFLFTQKSGNCVQFSSAMAVMLRSVGVPSRVLVGYAPGELDGATGNYILSSKERHAWPEVYFSGYGWVGFEATPGEGDEGIGISEAESLEVGLSSGGGSEEPFEEEIDAGSLGVGGVALLPDERRQTNLPVTFGGAVLLVLILWLAFSRWGSRSRRLDYASETYRKMCRLAALVGLEPRPQQTPLEYKARLASVLPPQAEALAIIVQAYVERQYSSGKELSHWQSWRVRDSWREVRRPLIKRLFRFRRR